MIRANTYLMYGDTGTYKTTQIKFLARYVWKKFKKRTRLVSPDNGGWQPVEAYIRAGLIIPYAIGSLTSPSTIARKLSRGDWPKDIGAGKAKLVPTTDWSEIGAYAVDGLALLGDALLAELRRDQRRLSEEPVSPYSIQIPESDVAEKFCANNRSHFGHVQREVMGVMNNFSALPVHYVLFTSHEAKGEEEDTKAAIRGPGIVGKAGTAKVPTLVGNCIHCEAYLEKQVTKVRGLDGKDFESKVTVPRVRAYFQRHPDPLFPDISYPAKPRLDSLMLPELLAAYPGGYFDLELDKGLDAFIELEESLTAKAAETLIQSMEPVVAPKKA